MKNSKGRRVAYYMVLLLCVAAVGVSGYVFVTAAVRSSRRQQTLTAAVTEPTTAQTGRMEQELTPAEPRQEKDPLQTAVCPVEGEVLQPYSVTALQYDKTNRDWRLHSAVDIGAEGQTVRSVMDGVVTSVTEDDLLGVTVTVQHEGGYESRYGCLAAAPAAQVGGRLTAGDAIGTVGDTALGESALAPHLHFELLKDGSPVDPMAVVN